MWQWYSNDKFWGVSGEEIIKTQLDSESKLESEESFYKLFTKHFEWLNNNEKTKCEFLVWLGYIV